MSNAEVIGPALLSISTAIGSFQSFLPNFVEIRRSTPYDDPDLAADVRMGELAAALVTVGVGAIITSLTGSNVPVTVSLVTALGLVFLYESTLQRHNPMGAK